MQSTAPVLETATLTTAEQKAVNTWCAEVRNLYSATKPITADDPRFAELLSYTRMDRDTTLALFTPEELADQYFTHFVKMPTFPLPAPSWAVTTTIAAHSYPAVFVTFAGPVRGAVEAVLDQDYEVIVADYDYDPEVGVVIAGTVFTNPPMVHGDQFDAKTVEETRDLAKALLQASMDMYEPATVEDDVVSPCVVWAWCEGHKRSSVEIGDDTHWGSDRQLYDFPHLSDQSQFDATLSRMADGEGPAGWHLHVEIETAGRYGDLHTLAQELRALARRCDAQARAWNDEALTASEAVSA